MTTTINAVAGTGVVTTSDGSGIVKLQSAGVTTNALAWVNFGYVASAITVRAQYNVSSITRNGTGIYTLNFTNNTSDANYSVVGTATLAGSSGVGAIGILSEYISPSNTYGLKTTSAVQINIGDNNTDTYVDPFSANVAIFGN